MVDVTPDIIDHSHDHHPTGWRRYLYSTNHKDIGTLYLIFAIIAGVIGGVMSVIMRIELMYPGDGILGGDHNLYNVLVTNHGFCLLYTSPSPRDVEESRMPSSA